MGKKIALVTGGSSGIGRAAAKALLRRGCTVYELSRHGTGGDVRHLTADVADEAAVRAAVAELLDREGRLDILVCCAGFGISGAAEFTDNDDAKRLLDVNLFGVVNACKAALGPMREQGGGRIVCVSSVAAPIAIPFQAWYSVSKAAINSYVGALRLETAPFGVSLCAVMPGDIRTGFTAAREKSALGDDIYDGRIARSVAVMEHDEENGMRPEAAGDFIAALALRRRVKPLYTVGWKYRFFVLLSRLLPSAWCSWLVGMIYAK